MKKHLAVFSKEHIEEIFSGTKAVEVRLSQKRIPPFGAVKIGDLVYIKPAGREIAGQFIVKKVISIEGIDEKDFELIRQIAKVSLPQKNNLNYATIIFVDQIEKFITPPIRIKKGDQRGWVVLHES